MALDTKNRGHEYDERQPWEFYDTLIYEDRGFRSISNNMRFNVSDSCFMEMLEWGLIDNVCEQDGTISG